MGGWMDNQLHIQNPTLESGKRISYLIFGM